jgi:hypothetical protein
MVSPFFSIRILKNRQWRIAPYSYIHNEDSRGDYSFLKRGIPSGISSRSLKIPFRRGDICMKRTSSYQIPKIFNKKFTIPPAPKAMGMTTADIKRAFFKPLSLAIIKNWAMQGMKRVMVTKLTRI